MVGFKKEEVRVRADSNDHVIVSGERPGNDNTILHFEQAYKVPEDCNIQETKALLEDETYYVIIPKKLDSKNENSISNLAHTEEQRAQESVSDGIDNNTIDESNQKRDEAAKDEPSDTGLTKKVMKMMKKKKCLVLTALVALSLGLIVSHSYKSTPQVETKHLNQSFIVIYFIT